jgi:glutamate carboxypeptidase
MTGMRISDYSKRSIAEPAIDGHMLENMHALLRYARSKQLETTELIRQFVECESPSDDAAAVNRFVELLTATVKDIAEVRTYPGGSHGRHIRCEFTLPGERKQGRILALGHSDTVWPSGTLRTMPFRRSKGRLWGPGVFDMKGGLALFIMAMRGLRELEIPVARKVVLQVNSDEEIGSPSSRPLTEEIARKSKAVLVLEPAAGLDGKAKTARKGVGDYTVTVRGIPAHAGLDFEKGVNAIVEMARQVETIAGFTRLGKGITVSPGVIRGGTRSNVVPAECTVEVDVRVPRMADISYVEKQFAGLRPFDKRCKIEVSGGVNRPPLERTPGVAALFRRAEDIAADIGVGLDECAVGGGSDGNFTGALGVPTLDGLGAIGDGAHAAHESILIGRLADRTALLGTLVASL